MKIVTKNTNLWAGMVLYFTDSKEAMLLLDGTPNHAGAHRCLQLRVNTQGMIVIADYFLGNIAGNVLYSDSSDPFYAFADLVEDMADVSKRG